MLSWPAWMAWAAAPANPVAPAPVPTPASAPAPDGKSLYAPCAVCHAPGAWGSPDGAIPSLAGQRSAYLQAQIALFSAGARTGTAMQLVTAHRSADGGRNIAPQDAAALANYLAGLDPDPSPVQGSGKHLRVGQEIYVQLCSGCHGLDARGDASGHVPRLAGQHDPYLRRQIEQAASLHRALVPRHMVVVLTNLYPAQRDAVADYLSRLSDR